MKTQSINPLCPGPARPITRDRSARLSPAISGLLLTALAAPLPAIVVMVWTLLALQAGSLTMVAAAYWAIGFVFLAASIETGGRTAMLSALSGVVSMLLAWLASRIAPEFAILAGVVVSAWLALATVKLIQKLHQARA